jgi:rhomboid family protein
VLLAGGLAATVTQTAVTLLAGTSADAQTPNLGASGAIAAPSARTSSSFAERRSAGSSASGSSTSRSRRTSGLFESSAHGGGVAFFAHVGGFVFGAVVARALVASGRLQDDRVSRGVWA